MRLIEHAKEGLLNLYFAKLRSILALLGVLVGTASVVAMVLGGQLATHEALKQFKTLGTDLLSVSLNAQSDEKSTPSGMAEYLTLSQALNLVTVSKDIVQVAPYTQLFFPVFYNANPIQGGIILGVTDDFADIVHLKLKAGRFISLMDKYEFYCVIGHDIYQALKALTKADPIGQTLQIGKHVFVIVGVAEPWPENNFVYANIDGAILIPILASMAVSQYANINNFIMRLTGEADINAVKDAIALWDQL